LRAVELDPEALPHVERKLRDHQRALVQIASKAEALHGLVAHSAAMRMLVALARRVAKVDSTVLITGESGVGKERVARMLHNHSSRAAGPFIAVNCGAIAETLLESELFGHARGAFTGAEHDRPGLFEAINHGTLLLGEVGEVSAAMQVKLLRLLQEREIRRVGENKSRRVRKDGSRLWAQVLLTEMRGASGTLIGFATVVRGVIGARKAAVLLAKVREVLGA
jgi:two-component system response regulator HydG